jgi:hypothetical protein
MPTRRLVKDIDEASIEDDQPMGVANFWLGIHIIPSFTN